MRTKEELRKEISLLCTEVSTFACKLGLKYHDAEDVAQDTMVKAFSNLEKYDQNKNLRTWINIIARNSAYNIIRKKKRIRYFRSIIDEDSELEKALVAPIKDNPSLRTEELDCLSILTQAIMSLSELRKNLIVRHYFLNETLPEISTGYSIPIGSLKSNLYYSRQKLRFRLAS